MLVKFHYFKKYWIENLILKLLIKEIDSISPQTGSTIGGTRIKINGKYFYNDIRVPAEIEIGGEPCELINFNMTNLPNTQFICRNSPQLKPSNEYYGNRGINLIRDDVYTEFNSLATAVPSVNAQSSTAKQISYNDTKTVDLTVWFKGFINPRVTSFYEFYIDTNASAALFVSTDSTSANKVL